MKKFCKGLLAVLEFPFWLIVYPFLMLIAWPCPCLARKKAFRWCADYGDKVKKSLLVGKRSSRASFTFAHGLLHFIIFLIAITIALWFHNSYINQSNAVKYKNLNIEVDRYSPEGYIQKDTVVNDKLSHFFMGWSNEEKDSTGYNPAEMAKGMSFHFSPYSNRLDTTFFRITIHADFDLRIDTTEIRKSILEDSESAPAFDYEIEKFGENDGKSFIVLTLMNLPQSDTTDWSPRIFSILSHHEMYEKDDPPYLNYYIHFSFGYQLLDLEPIKTRSNNELCFSFWDSYTFVQDKDSTNISNYPYFNVPYEILDAKPEPDTNYPYILIYDGESFKEAIERGLRLKFVNRDRLQQNDRRAFFNTVLIGALVSFMLTVLIELFTKWRNLNLRSGNKDPYGKE